MAENSEMKYCNNCKREIAAANFVIHEVHCRRNIILCDQCKEPVPRNELDEHKKAVHEPVTCDTCSESVERQSLDKHKAEDCRMRPCVCEYCELTCPASSLAEHTNYCGTRTEQCPLCSQFIMHRDRQLHDSSSCQLPVSLPRTVSGPLQRDDFDWRCLDDGSNDFFPPCLDDPFALGPRRLRSLRSQSYGDMGRLMPPQQGNDVNLRYKASAASEVHLPLTVDSDEMPNGMLGNSENMLPCEFCFDSFPANVLLQHQVFCGQNTLNNGPENESEINVPEDYQRLNSTSPSARNVTVPKSIPFFDNLSHFEPAVDESSENRDEVMLPCEFCEEPYPANLLSDHQVHCRVGRLSGLLSPEPGASGGHPAPHPAINRSLKNRQRAAGFASADKPSAVRSSRHQGSPPSGASRLSDDEPRRLVAAAAAATGSQRYSRYIAPRAPMYSRQRVALPLGSAEHSSTAAGSRNRDHLDSSVGTSKPAAASRSSENPPSAAAGFAHGSSGSTGLRLAEPSHRLGYSQQRPVAAGVSRTSNPLPRRIDLTQNTPYDASSNRGRQPASTVHSRRTSGTDLRTGTGAIQRSSASQNDRMRNFKPVQSSVRSHHETTQSRGPVRNPSHPTVGTRSRYSSKPSTDSSSHSLVHVSSSDSEEDK